MATHKSNIALWSGFFVLVLFCYHLFSDGDFSFLMVRTALTEVCACGRCSRRCGATQTFGSFVRAFGFAFLIFKAFSQRSVSGTCASG